MTKSLFFKHFEKNRSIIQQLASQLAEDFETARFLYLETAHQAMNNRTHLEQHTFEEWLMSTMKNTYRQLILGKLN